MICGEIRLQQLELPKQIHLSREIFRLIPHAIDPSNGDGHAAMAIPCDGQHADYEGCGEGGQSLIRSPGNSQNGSARERSRATVEANWPGALRSWIEETAITGRDRSQYPRRTDWEKSLLMCLTIPLSAAKYAKTIN